MENRIVVTICDQEYTLVAEESASYMQKARSYVSEKMEGILTAARVGRTDAAVLTAVNLADELFKEQAASEALRAQIQQALAEAGQAQNEVSELEREVFRLQQRLDNRNGNGNKR